MTFEFFHAEEEGIELVSHNPGKGIHCSVGEAGNSQHCSIQIRIFSFWVQIDLGMK